MEYFNIALLLLTTSYGVAFGVRNWVVRIGTILVGLKNNQSDIGQFLDAAFLMSTAYLVFYTDIVSKL